MGKSPPPSFQRLFVIEWIERLGRIPAEVERAGILSASYLSNIKKGRKANLSQQKIRLLADFLDIPMAALYCAPPPQSVIRDGASPSARQIAAAAMAVDYSSYYD
jgi:transcriptional regulator with XRE-family HTH domain